MPKFITLDATTTHENSSRPVVVNVDQIACYRASGNQYDANQSTLIVFAGGRPENALDRLVVSQTVDQVSAAIAGAGA